LLSFCDKMLTQARSCGFDSRPVPKPFRLGILMIRLYVLALVFSPIDLPRPQHAPAAFWKELKALAMHLEIVGPHERWIDDWRSEVGYVRRHWQELATAPPLADAARFPDPAIVKECRNFNRAYERLLEARIDALHDQEKMLQALRETHTLGHVWALLETATSENQSWVCRRRSLMYLREILQPEAYYAGKLPPAAPLHRFEEFSK
jgi:hypothetical protein